MRLLATITILSLMTAGSAAIGAEVVEDAAFAMDDARDLSFPAAPEPFAPSKASKMFKPDGAGPFPGLVVVPTCSGHAGWMHAFDWAKTLEKKGPMGQQIVYRYNPEITRESTRLAFEFLERNLKGAR